MPSAGCSKTYPPDLFQNFEEYKLDYVLGTLFDSKSDEVHLASVNLAIHGARQRGGLSKSNFSVIHCDISHYPEVEKSRTESIEEYSRFLAEKMHASVIVGLPNSVDSMVGFNQINQTQSVLISPAATFPSLSSIDGDEKTNQDPGLFWRTVSSDAVEAGVLAKKIRDHGHDKTAVIYTADDYGYEYVDALSDTHEGQLDVYELASSDSLFDIALEIAETSVTAIVFVSSKASDSISFINEAAGLSAFEQKIIYLNSTAMVDGLFDTDATLHSKIWGFRPLLPSGRVFEEFVSDVGSTVDVQSPEYFSAAHTYDASWLAIYGYTWAHFQESVINGVSIARGLRRLSDPLQNKASVGLAGWSTLESNFAAGEEIDIQGASGMLDFDRSTEELYNPIEVLRLNAVERCYKRLEICYSSGCESFSGLCE